jgi:hypothetical protein
MNDSTEPIGRRGYEFSGPQLLAVIEHALGHLRAGTPDAAAALLAQVVAEGTARRTFAGLRRYGVNRTRGR